MKKTGAYVCFLISALYMGSLITDVFTNTPISIPLKRKTNSTNIIQQLTNNKFIERKYVMLTIENPTIAEKIFLAQHGQTDFSLQLTIGIVAAMIGLFVFVLVKQQHFICASAVKYLNICLAVLSLYFLFAIIRRYVMDFYIHQFTTDFNFDKFGLGNTTINVWVLILFSYSILIYKKAVTTKQENDLTI